MSKWAVRLTRENVEIMEQWRSWKIQCLAERDGSAYGYLHSDKLWGHTVRDGYKLISFEEFQEHYFNK